MYISHGGGTNGDDDALAEEPGPNTVNRVEHYTCGAAGLLVAAAGVFLVYPFLVALARPLTVLSSTAVTVAFLVAWFATWALFECALTWRPGRAAAD